MDDDWDAPTGTTGAWDEDIGLGFGDDGADGDWDAEEVVEEKPKVVAKVAPKPAAPKAEVKPAAKKLSLKELAKQKEAEEAAEKAAAARARREQELQRDPDYLAKRKEQERRDMEESEIRLASDLFDGCKAPSKTTTVENPDKSDRAAALAASSGLFDGADGMAGINTPDEKSGPAAPPSVLDALDLNNKDHIAAFSTELSRKMNDYANSTSSTLLLKELFSKMGPAIKHDDLAELLRVVTVAKNDASKALQNKKKKSKKPQIKAVGSSYDNGGADYDDYDEDY